MSVCSRCHLSTMSLEDMNNFRSHWNLDLHFNVGRVGYVSCTKCAWFFPSSNRYNSSRTTEEAPVIYPLYRFAWQGPYIIQIPHQQSQINNAFYQCQRLLTNHPSKQTLLYGPCFRSKWRFTCHPLFLICFSNWKPNHKKIKDAFTMLEGLSHVGTSTKFKIFKTLARQWTLITTASPAGFDPPKGPPKLSKPNPLVVKRGKSQAKGALLAGQLRRGVLVKTRNKQKPFRND